MLLLLRPLAAVVFVFAAAAFGAHAASHAAHARFEAARARVDAECRAFRAELPQANVCRDDPYAPSAIKSLKEGERIVADARAKYARGDSTAAASDLRRALDLATEIDRRGTVVASLVAAKLVNESLDVYDAHRREMDTRSRMELLARVRLGSPDHPLRAERLAVLHGLVRFHDESLLPRPIADALAADAMLQDDAVVAEMERALLDRDAARCERAARGRTGPLASGSVTSGTLCVRLASVVAVPKRVGDELRAVFQDDPPAQPR